MGASRRRRACRRRVRNHTEPPDARPSAVDGAGPPRRSTRSGRQSAEPADRSDRTILAAIGVLSSARVGGRALPL